MVSSIIKKKGREAKKKKRNRITRNSRSRVFENNETLNKDTFSIVSAGRRATTTSKSKAYAALHRQVKVKTIITVKKKREREGKKRTMTERTLIRDIEVKT